ncbi:uncharacterized protein LOC115806977 [Chanos chanos]|uniref:Uncharacterized protein LOC115806977 n=1 Tax=Chanos chanos TaxID=29144 RepID=A0A6J2UXA1_CHACN|nr:uncharacterized protein LOC115806977 [Chanos chanos]
MLGGLGAPVSHQHFGQLALPSHSPPLQKMLGDTTHLPSLSQLFQAPEQFPTSLILKGRFSRAGLSTALAISSPASFRLWFRHRRPTFPIMRLSSYAVKVALDEILSQCKHPPFRPLADYTGPPGLGADHSYSRRSSQEASLKRKRASARKSVPSSSPQRHSKVRLLPEKSLEHLSRHGSSPKPLRLESSPAEPLNSFALASANVKYPGLHSRGTSREVIQALIN